jgi:hypothetical protein
MSNRLEADDLSEALRYAAEAVRERELPPAAAVARGRLLDCSPGRLTRSPLPADVGEAGKQTRG